jgi:hypothetical protein
MISQHTIEPGSRSALPFAGHANVVEDRVHHRRVVDVPAGESPAQRSPLTSGNEVDLAGQAAPGASDRVVRTPLDVTLAELAIESFFPAAALRRMARTA